MSKIADKARTMLGVMEDTRPGMSNPLVDRMFDAVGHPKQTDDTAWCAAFVGWVLEGLGIRSTRMLTAKSYLRWGTPVPVDMIQPGDIIVTDRPPEAWMGHVEIAVDRPRDGRVRCIGGNERNGVRENYTDLDKIVGARRAPGPATMPKAVQAVVASSNERFDALIGRVGISEGGYVNHPADRGGPTNHGITQKVLSQHRGRDVSIAEVKALTWAEAKAIYKRNYWDAIRADRLPPGLDYIVWDMAINHGNRRSIMIMQEALGVVPDGIFGPATLKAVDALRGDGEAIRRKIEEIADKRNAFYDDIVARRPSQQVFRRGWANRSERVKKDALSDVNLISRVVRDNPGKTATATGGLAALLMATVGRLFGIW